MPLYRNTSGALHAIQEQPFKLEKEIQTLVEENLAELMSLELVKSEFSVKNRRIDTLAFDPQTRGWSTNAIATSAWSTRAFPTSALCWTTRPSLSLSTTKA